MEQYDTILIRFGELSTKGKNRRDFINCLLRNIKRSLKDHPGLSYRKTYDRIYIRLGGGDIADIEGKLKKIFGISSFSFTYKVASDIEAIKETCLKLAEQTDKKTFKIVARRHDKSFPMRSDDINRTVAGLILQKTSLKVDVHEPQLKIMVEVHTNDTYITADKIPGAGGYPTGINGRVLLLLSGGIDSPVAAYELMKRGLEVEAVHFASPPYTSSAAKNKVLSLAEQLSFYEGRMIVHVVNFTDLQLAIYKACGDPYAITIMRRMMFRLSQRIARDNKCLAIATGESVGQVASQTLESIACINAVISMPVIRPLICFDKLEIIDVARKIGTYETSILPYDDCCTIFDPKNPVTRPTEEKCTFHEAKFAFVKEIDNCLDTMETLIIQDDEKQEEYL